MQQSKSFYIDLKYLPLFKGYIFLLVIRYYVFAYYIHTKAAFKAMSYGNIFTSLLKPFTNLILMVKVIDKLILKDLEKPLQVYSMLSSKEVTK